MLRAAMLSEIAARHLSFSSQRAAVSVVVGELLL